MDGRELKFTILSWTLRLLIGAVFCVSAVAKLIVIDDFELYIYSFGWLSLSLSFMVARLCIGVEMALALWVWTGWFPKVTKAVTLFLLLVFSLFLCYAALIGRNESCECFGRLLDVNPAQSLLKNGVLILLGLGYFKVRGEKIKEKKRCWKVWVIGVLSPLCLALPFVVSIPDNWGFGPSQEPYNHEALKEALIEGNALSQMGVGEGRRLVAFVTPRCPYCQLARRKIDSMAKRHDFSKGSVVYVQPSDIKELFLQITCVNGICSRPLILLMDGDSVIATYHLRNVDEKQVADFLKNR